MPRPKPQEGVQARPPAPEAKGPDGGIGPGWTIALACWVVFGGVLLVYEAWGFFGGFFGR